MKFHEHLLHAREIRAWRQSEILKAPYTLICLTLNIPGLVKTNSTFEFVFDQALHRIRTTLDRCSIEIVEEQVYRLYTGDEGYLLVDAEAGAIKALMIEIEEEDGLGRIFDIDVYGAQTGAVHREDLGHNQRYCIVCKGNPAACRRLGRHQPSEIRREIYRRIISGIGSLHGTDL